MRKQLSVCENLVPRIMLYPAVTKYCLALQTLSAVCTGLKGGRTW